MRATPKDDTNRLPRTPDADTDDVEREAIRESNDRDQSLEREGIEAGHNRGSDQAVRRRGQPSRDADSRTGESRDNVRSTPKHDRDAHDTE